MSSPDHTPVTPAAASPPVPAQSAAPVRSPILSVDRSEAEPHTWAQQHSHPEPKLVWTSTATLAVTAAARDWLVPPGYGLWIPGGIEHAVTALRWGEGAAITFDPNRCPVTWARPTGVTVRPLLRELIDHQQEIEPQDPSRPHAEALVFELLTPLPDQTVQVSMPTDPRVRAIAERLIADPADQRDLAAWADQAHAGVRTLARLFLNETGLSFARWRTQVRIHSAIGLLAGGATVDAVARAVGYRKTSAFISAFRRATGQTPGTYISPNHPTAQR